MLTRTLLLGALCLSLLCFPAMGQQRSCDLQVTLIEPADGSTIAGYAQFDIRVKVKNLGPDSLFAGDTLFYNLPTELVTVYHAHVLEQGMAPGTENHLLLDLLTNVNENENEELTNFCVTVRNDYFNTGAFVDPNLSNNRSCNEVRFSPTTGIQHLRLSKELYSISPNPTHSQLSVTLKNASFKPERLFIMSYTGRILRQEPIHSVNRQFQIDLSQLASGVYLIGLPDSQGTLQLQRMVKL